jgi:hypothetical protein
VMRELASGTLESSLASSGTAGETARLALSARSMPAGTAPLPPGTAGATSTVAKRAGQRNPMMPRAPPALIRFETLRMRGCVWNRNG